MSFDVPRRAGLRAAPADQQARPWPPQAPQRRARLLLWLASAGIGSSLAVIVAVSLARESWMGPPLTMPGIGPPFELSSWHLSVVTVTIALWITALTGGIGMAAGLLAVRRGARPPARLLLITAAVVVAVLTVLPPVGSTLDYMAFGRMVVLGHSPYVMVPWDLIHLLRGDPAARLRAHLLWTINPLLIWQLIAAAHLDVLAAAAGMLGLLVAGGWPGSQLNGRPPASQRASRSSAACWRRACSSASQPTSRPLSSCSASAWPGPCAGPRSPAWPRPAGCWPCCCRATPGSGRRPSGPC